MEQTLGEELGIALDTAAFVQALDRLYDRDLADAHAGSTDLRMLEPRDSIILIGNWFGSTRRLRDSNIGIGTQEKESRL